MGPGTILLILLAVAIAASVFFGLRWYGRLGEEACRKADRQIRAASELRRVSGGEYLAHSLVQQWRRKYGEAAGMRLTEIEEFSLPPDLLIRYSSSRSTLDDIPTAVRSFNQEFVTRRMSQDKRFLDNVENFPLSPTQRQAVVTDEDATLVVAGAGAGKTATIAAKVAYLVKRGLATPDQILVLAFAKAAQEELAERIKEVAETEVQVSTFHKLGYDIIGSVEGEKPPLSRMSEDDKDRRKFLSGTLRILMNEPTFFGGLSSFFTELLSEEESWDSFDTGDDYFRRMRTMSSRTLNGTLVKSQQERKIGNWLTLSGIKWKYEKRYGHQTTTKGNRAYTPDFFLPDFGLWIEHYGINRSGQTAPWVDAKKYTESMGWKRKQHKRFGTKIVETFSYDAFEGKLTERLASRLRSHGVKPRNLGTEEMDALLEDPKASMPEFVKLIDAFLNLYRVCGMSSSDVRTKATTGREKVFFDLFDKVHERYTAELSRERKIDFAEMITQATTHVESGRYTSPFRYIIIDEFQDISMSRLSLVKAIRSQVDGAKFFCVGDDWQAIFRFAGSDVSVFTGLSDHVGATERVDLHQTFRCSQAIVDASSAFVTRNQAQLKKTVRSHSPARTGPGVCVRSHSGKEAGEEVFRVLEEIAAETAGVASVILLGRYWKEQPENFDQMRRDWSSKGLSLEFKTIHGSKGLECDYVILLGNRADAYGFPSEISDDPVMRLVMSDPDTYRNAEERRLMYVALTRARIRAYLLAPAKAPSDFVVELQEPDFGAWVQANGDQGGSRIICPLCGGHTISKIEGQYGEFWGCLNYPLCSVELDWCPDCRKRGLLPHKVNGVVEKYRCCECGQCVEPCPRCDGGRLVMRSGPYSEFLGCTNFSKTGCDYTRNS